MKFGLNNYSSKNKERFLPNVYGSKDGEEWARNKTWMNKNKDQYNDWQKTYFKGLETKYNKLGDATTGGIADQPKDKLGAGGNFGTEGQGDDEEHAIAGGMTDKNAEQDNYKANEVDSKDNGSDIDENELKKQAVHDFKDSYEMSKMVLQRCNKLPVNNHGFLKSGDGHFVSMPHTNIKNSYLKVFYNDDISTASNKYLY